MKRSHKYSKARLETLEAELSKKDRAASAMAGQREGNQAPTHARKDENARVTNSDPLLQPIDVRMGRGRDKQLRMRKASQPVLTECDDEGDVEMEE
jgi:hypothetical protein